MLEALLSPTLLPGEQERPQRLLDAMRYAALDGGKRLRPFLVIESAALFGASGSGVLRAALTVERDARAAADARIGAGAPPGARALILLRCE